ncbi:MAG: hypothetical protein HYX65_02530 [Gemmatimonadetes bacterium]|nr:hypothetical protein [Gemmatimonadota bacterium]
MRSLHRLRHLALTGTLAIVAACDSERATSSTADARLAEDLMLGVGTSTSAQQLRGGGPPDINHLLRNAPDSIKPTADQVAAIAALQAAFETASAADLTLLRQLHDSAMALRGAGASRDDVRAVLATGDAARTRLRAAQDALRDAIDAVLTDAQKAWLKANLPPPFAGGPFGPGERRRGPGGMGGPPAGGPPPGGP